jgi:hypothetical protein
VTWIWGRGPTSPWIPELGCRLVLRKTYHWQEALRAGPHVMRMLRVGIQAAGGGACLGKASDARCLAHGGEEERPGQKCVPMGGCW